MLDTLRSLVQEVNSARNLKQALSIIVQRIKPILNADICSVFLLDVKKKDYVLMASDGLDASAIGHVRLAHGEGLVGQVAKRAEPLTLDDAPSHPHYRYFPETGEENYRAFLGVPIIHHRKVVGVLVVQRADGECFDEDSETLLITMAAQLAAAIAHAEVSGEISEPDQTLDVIEDARMLRGQSSAQGIAIGTACVVASADDIHAVPDRQIDNVSAELISFNTAIKAVKSEIEELARRLKGKLPKEELALFDVYALMLESDSFSGAIRSRIEKGSWAAGALRQTIEEHEKIFRDMDDPYLRERIDDIRDLGRRVLKALLKKDQSKRHYYPDTVLVGEEITPAILADVPTECLRGVISVRGSRTSHVAILARALGVATVMGVADLPVGRVDGARVIVDGYAGRVYIQPNETICKEYRRLLSDETSLSEELKGLRDLPAETQDGIHIPLYVNTGLLSDLTPTRESGAEGVGLYRTEVPFMVRQRFPGEDEQKDIYRKVLEAFAPRPVVLRTLDVGGDKALPYFPIKEDNPFLGWRGIRITLDHPEIFLVQIRAMLRASADLNNLNILLPMISDVQEVQDALGLIHQAYGELLEDGLELAMPRIGVMIEVPSAVYQAGSLARRVDFLSIGTNDLTQYLLAVDRNNARVAALYDSLHPAVIRAMLQVVESARVHGKPVSVCGEMAGDPAAVLLLVGMGIQSLSMSVSSLPGVKWVIRNFSRDRAEEILGEVLVMEEVDSVRDYLNSKLEEVGLGGLIRAGK